MQELLTTLDRLLNSMGLPCVRCARRHPEVQYKTCARCRAEIREALQELKVRRILAGQCVRHGLPCLEGQSQCELCQRQGRARRQKHGAGASRGGRKPDPRCDVYVIRWLDGHTLREIAHEFHVSKSAVRSVLIHRNVYKEFEHEASHGPWRRRGPSSPVHPRPDGARGGAPAP